MDAMMHVNGSLPEEAIRLSVTRFFGERFGLEVPSADTNLIEAGAMDSLMLVDLVMYLEEQFEVATSLDDLDPDNFASVANIARFIAARSTAAKPIV